MNVVFSFVWLIGGITVLLVILVFVIAWSAKEYFSLPGHFEVSNQLIGETGVVKAPCSPETRGKVYVAGAYWDAICESGTVPVDSDIEVVEVRGKILVVKPVDLISKKEEQIRKQDSIT